MSKAAHPDEVLSALLTKATRSQKAINLRKLHDVCAAQHGGAKDFSLPSIGKLWETAGGIKARALYNAPSEDYRTLIKAWQDFSGPAKVAAAPKAGSRRYPYLSQIEDPAVRALVQAGLIERDKFEAEIKLLKALTTLEIDRRPVPSPAGISSPIVVVESTDFLRLTESERLALERAVSPDFLAEEGWSETSSGSVKMQNGRTIFDHGFTKAIRKVLEATRVREKRSTKSDS